MADTPKEGETVVQEPPKNDVTPVVAPASQVNLDEGAIEQAKKETEQAKMRANQLENELKKLRDEQEKAKQKELEEQEQWKEIAEQNKAKADELQKEKEDGELKQTLTIAEQAIFAEFSPEAIEVAKEAGLSLTEDSDDAKNTLKTKLENIQKKVVSSSKVTPNNPGTQSPETEDRAKLVEAMRAGNREARSKAMGTIKALDEMRAQAGYTTEQ